MKTPFPSVPHLLALAIALGLFSSRPAGAAEPAGEILLVQVQGTVEVMPAREARWLAVSGTNALRLGDRIRSGPQSRGAIRWADKSVVSFGPGAEFEISDSARIGANGGVQLVRGVFSFFHRDRRGQIPALTRGSAAGTDGTEFVMNVEVVNGVEQTTLAVIDGTVRLTNHLGTLVLTNGQQGFATPGEAPRLVAGFVANNILQWAFYYPAVIDLREVPLSDEETRQLAASIDAYRAGDLLAALAAYPAGRTPASGPEKIFRAALLLSVGEVAPAGQIIGTLQPGVAQTDRLGTVLRQLISAVRRDAVAPAATPQLASEQLAASYLEQSRALGDATLRRALALARQAAKDSPQFAFAWARVAELEFSFGRRDEAMAALDRALELAPRHAQALALKGFVTAAQNDTRGALEWFNRAIATDAALGNAWLGRGLARIRRGDVKGGREDLLVAAALEPQRAFPRSYLGKAHEAAGDTARALGELDLARRIDPADPTAPLYSALIKAEHNRVNEAIRDLELSQEMNDNRGIYRSSLLLDQDRAVRSANLARIYADAGMSDVALREAGRAVSYDYANYSAHLFLANSYAQMRDLSTDSRRYETPAYNEYLLASLLGPADGRLLAQSLSQQEYGRFFDRDTLGLGTSTEYLSRGAWRQGGVQYGTIQNLSWALEADYLTDPGQARHTDMESTYLSAKVKLQLTPADSLLFMVDGMDQRSGDSWQRHDPRQSAAGVHTRELQGPNLTVGFAHIWSDSQQTLLLYNHTVDRFTHTNFHGPTLLATEMFGSMDGFFTADLDQRFHQRLAVDSAEAQHLARCGDFQTIAGIRFQSVRHEFGNRQIIHPHNSPGLESYFGNPGTLITNQSVEVDGFRVSPYLHEQWQVVRSLVLIGGVSYDYQEQPRNIRFAPMSDRDQVQSQISPKGGFVWTPDQRSTVRAGYARSLGGISLDQSVRLEPAQVAGFASTYRTVFPDSMVGGISGAHSDVVNALIDHRLRSGTYLALGGEWLRGLVEHDVGAYRRDLLTGTGPGVQTTERLRFEERSLELSAHQLIGDAVSAGLSYRVSDAELERRFPGINSAFTRGVAGTGGGLLHLVAADMTVRWRCGFFAGANARWWSQDLRGNLGGLNEDTFWQVDLAAGYRFARHRAELTAGVLNVTDQGYRLHPVNLHPYLARERTFFTRLRMSF
jgi:tetratricopeptide (TPR) repeat protein